MLSVTRARVNLSGLWTFYQHTRQVRNDLPTQPGLLAHDVRLRRLGTHAWTYTLWLDYESLVEFRTGFTHTRAVMRAGRTLEGADFWLYACPHDYLPSGWEAIDQVIAGTTACTPLPPRSSAYRPWTPAVPGPASDDG